MNEFKKMSSGQVYNAQAPELVDMRKKAQMLCRQLVDCTFDEEKTREVYQQLFGSCGADVWVQAPFYCDYGCNIHLGEKVYFNVDCVILDPAPVTIGTDVMLGPGVHIYTADHPLPTTYDLRPATDYLLSTT